MTYRTEAEEFEKELTEFGMLLFDAVPNREQWDKFFSEMYGVVIEGKDLISMPPRDRGKALASAFTGAGAAITKASIKYSDEVPDVPGA